MGQLAQLGHGARDTRRRGDRRSCGPRERPPRAATTPRLSARHAGHARDGSHRSAVRETVCSPGAPRRDQAPDGRSDIAAISVLLEAASIADGHRALGEHQWLDLVQGGREGFAGFVARESGRERIVAYAQISRGKTASWGVEYVVHPQWRSAGVELLQELLEAALGEIAAQGGGHVHMWVPKPGPVNDAVARPSACNAVRDLVQMRRALPVIEERPADVGPAVSDRGGRAGMAGGEQPCVP